MFTLSRRRTSEPVNVFGIYGIERTDLQEIRISFKVGIHDRAALVHDVESYCKFKGFTYTLTHDSGWRITQYVLSARGSKEQMAGLEEFLTKHPVFDQVRHTVPGTAASY